jgi:hypothetical protein
MIVSKGNDQVTLTSKFEARDDTAVIRNAIPIIVQYSELIALIGLFFQGLVQSES